MPANTSLALNPLPLQDPDGGTLSLTRFSGFGAAIVAALTTVNKSWETIFGAHTPNWAKPVFLMAVVGAWALVAASDILSRGYAAGNRGELISLPDGLTALYTPGTDQTCAVAGVRFNRKKTNDSEFLIIKPDGTSVWAQRGDLEFKDEEEDEPEARGRVRRTRRRPRA